MTITRRQLGPGKCRVYVIEMGDTGIYKIGLSCSPAQRFLNLNLPYPIKVICIIRTPDAAKLEHKMHAKFKSKRMRNEWFRLSEDDLSLIRAMTGAVSA